MANRFINYRKLKELQEASKAGNEKAKVIIDKYMEEKPDMDSIDRLLEDYYSSAPIETLEKVETRVEVEPEPDVIEPESTPETIEQDAEIQGEEAIGEQIDPLADGSMPEAVVVDISADLDRELDGLIDADEIDDHSFRDYLGTKRKNAMRAKKDASYFKAFDQAGREDYLARKKDEYAHGFDGKLRDSDRAFDDINSALDGYGNMVTDLPDDELDIDVNVAGQAYDEFTGDDSVMGAFGRSWDEADNGLVKDALSKLVAKFGKKNVMAALNTIREDNRAWHDESRGRIESSISKYGKSLDSLLK